VINPNALAAQFNDPLRDERPMTKIVILLVAHQAAPLSSHPARQASESVFLGFQVCLKAASVIRPVPVNPVVMANITRAAQLRDVLVFNPPASHSLFQGALGKTRPPADRKLPHVHEH